MGQIKKGIPVLGAVSVQNALGNILPDISNKKGTNNYPVGIYIPDKKLSIMYSLGSMKAKFKINIAKLKKLPKLS